MNATQFSQILSMLLRGTTHDYSMSFSMASLNENLRQHPKKIHFILYKKHFAMIIFCENRLFQVDSLKNKSPIKSGGVVIGPERPMKDRCARYLIACIKAIKKHNQITPEILRSLSKNA